MKELYISPQLEVLRFIPAKGIATDTFGQKNGSLDNQLSIEESRPGDFNVPVAPDGDFLN